MTELDIARFESDFATTIPKQWRGVLTDDSACEKMRDTGLLTRLEDIVRENRLYRENPHTRDYWQASWIAIYADGSGNVYFLDPEDRQSQVFELDHEKTFPGYDPRKRPIFSTIAEFLQHIATHEL